jgi:hypothetical protein
MDLKIADEYKNYSAVWTLCSVSMCSYHTQDRMVIMAI